MWMCVSVCVDAWVRVYVSECVKEYGCLEEESVREILCNECL